MLKVIVVDDHKVVRDGLKLMLNEPAGNIKVVAEAASAQDLITILPDTTADIVLLDINLPGMDGLEAVSYLKKHYPAQKVLMLSMMEQEDYVAKALEAGADGYLTKTVNRKELLDALHLVADGNKYITTQISLKLLRKVKLSSSPAVKPDNISKQKLPENLSKRELEVLRLIAEGYTAEKIAGKLFTSKRTVETHRQNILDKTKAKNTANLVRYAARHHLLD